MPNIFYVNPNNGIYGGNKIVFEHCNNFSKMFQKCFIVCDDDVPKWMKVDAYFLNRDTAMRLIRPDDIVVFHWDYDADYIMKCPALNKYYLIQHFFHFDESIFKLPINFIAVSSYIQKHTKDNYGVEASLVMNCIDANVFYPRKIDREKYRVFAIDRGGWKGLRDIKKAERIVKRIAKQARFVYKDNLTPDEMAEEYSRAGIFVSASWREGFGLPVLEAMACGAAVVTTDSKGIDDFAFNGKNCLKTPVKEPKALAAAIIELLNNDIKNGQLRKEALAVSGTFAWSRSMLVLAKLFHLADKINDVQLFRNYLHIKQLTTIPDQSRSIFGKQVFKEDTDWAKLKLIKGGARLLSLLKYVGIKDSGMTGEFDYNKVSFVSKPAGMTYDICASGSDILYVPELNLK